MKDDLDRLAIFGGSPAFGEQLHVGRPNIGDRHKLLERFEDILERRWLSNDGCYVQEFEREIGNSVGVSHCVAMCNATIGLEIAIRALELSGEVIVPSFTFIATANALQWLGITPVFCDIDPRSHTLDPRLVEQLITPRTTGIIPVHLWGRPCKIDELSDIATRYKLKLLFDSAHAFGCTYQGQAIGGFGDVEVFSFHATKFLNSLEGGAVVTNNPELAHKMRLMRNFGFSDYDRTDSIGVNGKLNEVSAAMGLTNLESIGEFIATNRRHYKQYQEELAGLPGINLLHYDEREQSNYQYVVLELEEATTGVSRDQLMQILHAERVLARRYFYPGCHRMEPYRSLFPDAGRLLPETERLSTRVLALPTGTAVTTEDITKLVGIIRMVIANGSLVKTRLEQ